MGCRDGRAITMGNSVYAPNSANWFFVVVDLLINNICYTRILLHLFVQWKFTKNHFFEIKYNGCMWKWFVTFPQFLMIDLIGSRMIIILVYPLFNCNTCIQLFSVRSVSDQAIVILDVGGRIFVNTGDLRTISHFLETLIPNFLLRIFLYGRLVFLTQSVIGHDVTCQRGTIAVSYWYRVTERKKQSIWAYREKIVNCHP